MNVVVPFPGLTIATLGVSFTMLIVICVEFASPSVSVADAVMMCVPMLSALVLKPAPIPI